MPKKYSFSFIVVLRKVSCLEIIVSLLLVSLGEVSYLGDTVSLSLGCLGAASIRKCSFSIIGIVRSSILSIRNKVSPSLQYLISGI